ncbi:MAG: glycosyltransferase family 4 protein [Chitinophagaceae bacterium]|nr:glycosyltransferase family 4 protein [Chitinophagaceae bacterium]
MKILFIARATLYKDTGGDTIQILRTADYLVKEGVQVSIRLANEEIDYKPFDLIHFFNIIRPSDILFHVKVSRKPYVVSTIYVDYSEYEKKVRKGFAGCLARSLPPDTIEYLKVIARYLLNGERIVSRDYFWSGHGNSVKKIIKESSFLLPNSQSEYNRLTSHYKIQARYKVIPNAIDPLLFVREDYKNLRSDRLVICVGRIEGRKNQLNLIKALNNTAYELKIIGSPSANQQSYYNACRQEAAGNVSFIPNTTQQELVSYYLRAKVHVLASWFETTGLSSLEAAVLGCNIVITDKGDSREYFEDYAYYCNPESPDSIFSAVERASSSYFDERIRFKILTQYTWMYTAQRTLEAYREVIGELII